MHPGTVDGSPPALGESTAGPSARTALNPDELFFIVGTGRCGSTLLQAMLSSHRNLYIPPELRYFGRHEPGLRFSDPLRDGEVEAYLAQCRRDVWWTDMGLDTGAFDEAVRGGRRTSRDIYLWLLGHIVKKRGNRKRRFGDKTPYYALLVDHIAELFPRARFIHLYRDPRDVVASYLEQYWVSGGTALRLAHHVLYVFRRLGEAADRLGPARLCDVKYEDLVAHPERELRRLCEFLGEPYDPAMLEFEAREDAGYLEVEEGWKGLTRKGLSQSRIGRFRKTLTPRQIWTVEKRLRSPMAELGYEPSLPPSAPFHWHVGLWAERIYRKVLLSFGVSGNFLDERAVLNRRNQLIAERSVSAS